MNKFVCGLLAGASGLVVAAPLAFGQASIAQPVVPGYQAPVASPGQGPVFIPSMAQGAMNQVTFACTNTSGVALASNSVTQFLVIQNTSTASVWLTFNGSAATTGSPSFELFGGATGSSVIFSSGEISFIPTAQIQCSSSIASSAITLMYH